METMGFAGGALCKYTGVAGRSGRDGNCGRVLGCLVDAKRRDQAKAEDTQGKWLWWLVNVLKEVLLEWYHPESSLRR